LLRGIRARTICSNGHDLTVPLAFIKDTQHCYKCWKNRYTAAGQRYRAKKQYDIPS
jgi:hypothetical protein